MNNSITGASKKYLYEALLLIIIMVLSVAVFNKFLAKGINGFRPAMFSDMVYGTAAKPYVHRALVPTAVRLVASVIPDAAKQALIRLLQDKSSIAAMTNRFFFPKAKLEQQSLPAYVIAVLLMYFSLAGFLWAVRFLFKSLYSAPLLVADIVPLIALAGLPFCFKYYSYLYDFSTLFLFTLGLGLMITRRWYLYIAVFSLSCLNKETVILLTLLCIIHYREQMNHAWLKNLILAQVLIYAGIKSILTILFINNPGSIVEFHLFDHNMQLLSFYPLGKIFLWLGIIVTGTILAFYNWSAKPDFLKHGLWLCIPLVFCTMLFGFVDELRVYYEVYPIIILLVYQSLCELAGIHLEKVAI